MAGWQQSCAGLIEEKTLRGLAGEEEACRRRFLAEFGQGGARPFVALKAGRPAGRLVLMPSRDPGAPPDLGEIAALYLLAPYWGQGLGGRMMDFARRELAAMGHRRIMLWVLRENARAQAFYHREGFCETGGEKQVLLGGTTLNQQHFLWEADEDER